MCKKRDMGHTFLFGPFDLLVQSLSLSLSCLNANSHIFGVVQIVAHHTQNLASLNPLTIPVLEQPEDSSSLGQSDPDQLSSHGIYEPCIKLCDERGAWIV